MKYSMPFFNWTGYCF